MGRKPKPDAIKKAEGTYRKDRSNPQQPRPKAMLPEPPEGLLDEVGAREYRRAGRMLMRLGVMSELDAMALTGYAAAVSDLYRAEAHPAASLKYQALQTIRAFMTEFGMTPASRAKVNATPPESEAAKTARKYLIH